MRRRMLALLAVFAVFMAVTVAASAEETDASGTDAVGEGSAEGRGWVWAKGTGVAILDGQGRVHMAIDGDVVIYDYAGDAVVKIGAMPEDEPDGAALQDVDPTTTYTFDNFRGRLTVAGSDFRIEAEGTMKFRGHGQGVVEVEGEGVWKTLHRRGTWNGAVLSLGG